MAITKELSDAINQWKAGFPGREVKIYDSPIKPGESILKCIISVPLTLSGLPEIEGINREDKIISVDEVFQTFAQSDSRYPASGDTYRLNKLFEALEQRFETKFTNALNEVSQLINNF
jgi:hypothetical protein